jgi:hypothetical protein
MAQLGEIGNEVMFTGSVVSSAARTIEVEDRYGRTRRQVDAPLRWAVVCFAVLDQVTILILDRDGQSPPRNRPIAHHLISAWRPNTERALRHAFERNTECSP